MKPSKSYPVSHHAQKCIDIINISESISIKEVLNQFISYEAQQKLA